MAGEVYVEGGIIKILYQLARLLRLLRCVHLMRGKGAWVIASSFGPGYCESCGARYCESYGAANTRTFAMGTAILRAAYTCG